MAQRILITLFTVLLGSGIGRTYAQTEPTKMPHTTSSIDSSLTYYKPSPNHLLDILEGSIKKFIHTTEDIISNIQDASTVYISNLENGKISQTLRHNSGPCSRKLMLEGLEESFKIEIDLMELPLRNTIDELKDKFQDVKRSLDIQKNVLEIRFEKCKITEGENCTTADALSIQCTNGTCSSEKSLNVFDLLKNKESSESRQYKAITPSSYSKNRITLETECDDGFRCTNRECISSHQVCNGHINCNDYSDERSGCSRTCLGRRCRNLNCVTEDQICNGKDDCGDGTDEVRCPKFDKDECNLSLGSFLCANASMCIGITQMCNNRTDCPDHSDEDEKCYKPESCSHCVSAGGSCLLTPTGPQCLRKCPPWFSLALKTGICIPRLSESDPYIFYDDNSIMGVLEKLKILTNRFSSGYVHLKKNLNYKLEKIVKEFSLCKHKEGVSLSEPFSIF